MTAEAFDAVAARAALDALADTPVTPLAKGFAGLAGPTTPRALVESGVRVTDERFSTPSLVVSAPAVRHNIAVLADFCRSRDVQLAPHAKTTMSPELFVAQLEAGAWALTAANPWQAAVFVAHGARRVLIANEVADPGGLAALRRLLDTTEGLEVLVHVDSTRGVELLAPLVGRRLRLLVDVGVAQGRTGVRSGADVVSVARAAHAAGLEVAGVSCFEGPVTAPTPELVVDGVRELCRSVRLSGRQLAELGLLGGGLVLSAGGSHFFDVVAEELWRDPLPGTSVVVRSGAYVVHDHGVYLRDSPSLRGADLPEFVPALRVRTTVVSAPEPGLVLLNAGRRDVSFDEGLPVVLAADRGGEAVDVREAEVVALNDQHGFLRVTGEPLQVGDTVVLGISHPCTAMDKWQHALLADDEGRVTGVAHTFF
ncbi:D-serine deaminase-like pyridoxal phosphate-dependent protein [Motilibacter peucedani]|uniref:D-serine deaminase-like pyridoxal phosphate-dependent protein n=1 Tax=Motilibacter peucedani TaxID=598650 RepID=A0A420XNI3_9ACTN|nr:alanine racemase [Motilibacter peucedani]RKS73763.1 D-serine deaminase-like pyridoxal phosphate-dependent protein [Motilibacter peucedani]